MRVRPSRNVVLGPDGDVHINVLLLLQMKIVLCEHAY
jgi:hypothetical protein